MPIDDNDIVDGRYRILGVLGQGGAGRVYRAADLAKGGEVVALKVLERTDEKWAAGFRREFETLAAMSHPNVVRVMDFGPGVDPGTAYFTAELVVGDDIYRATENSTVGERLGLITEMVRALAFVHNRGILHRDLKPANVLVSPQAPSGERVKLVDFGLARGASRRGQVTLFAGTPPYMAPELLEGQPPTVATDLYALGVTIYRLLRREMPYQAKNAAALQIARSQSPPPPLPEEVSADVAQFIHDLMDPDPRRRPSSAASVSARLERSEVLVSGRPPVVLGEAPLLGRIIPLTILKVAFDTAARSRQGGVVFLTGPAGIGKSRLVAAFEDNVQVTGGRVASARCEPGEDGPSALVQLSRAVLAFAGRSAPGASQRLLFGAARGIVPNAPAELGALAAALDAGPDPRVLIIDDAHHADEPTQMAISHLAAQTVAPRLLVVCARDDASARWSDTLRLLLAMPGVQRVVLPPLNQSEARALAASLLGRAALPMDLLKSVDRAGGVPRLVEDAVKRLVPLGVFRPTDSGLTYVPSARTRGLDATTSSVTDPIVQASVDDRLLLCALTLSDSAQTAAGLALALDRRDLDVSIALTSLEQRGLVERRQGAGADTFLPTALTLRPVPRRAEGSQVLEVSRAVRAAAGDGTLSLAQRAAARLLLRGGADAGEVAELLVTSGLSDDPAQALLLAADEHPTAADAPALAQAALHLDATGAGRLTTEERARARRAVRAAPGG
jgi:serine/threonine-protein kinase